MPSVVVHIQNEDPVLGEIENLPSPVDTMIIIKNPRKRDGKDLHYLDNNVNTVIWPVTRINFIEIMNTGDDEEIISFVRE